jgi:SAM-dependent methyltransferase
MDEVVGQFDWIVDFNFMKQYFGESYTGVGDFSSAHVLVVGCGTSTLSHAISTELNAAMVLSIDNDEKCISYMQEKHAGDHRMKWAVFDMIEDALKGNSELMKEKSFDIVVDKGSLDAMLVEGSIANLLLEVYRVLKEGGVYFLCSLHAPSLLRELMCSPPLGYEVLFPASTPDELESQDINGRYQTIALCRKEGPHRVLNVEEMVDTEDRVMDAFYQMACPFLTAEKRAEIETFFHEESKNGSVPLTNFHSFVFRGDMMLDYTFELFLEDILDSQLTCPDEITFDEAIIFLSSKQ